MVLRNKVLLTGLVVSMVAMPLASFAKDGRGELENESHRSAAVRTVKVRGVVTAVSATSIAVTAAPRVEDNHNSNSNENGNSNTNGNSNANGNTNSSITPVSVTLTINDNTIILGKHNRRARVSDIQLGDRVTVRATSRTNGIAVKIEDTSIRLIEVKGFFTNVNQAAGTFTVTRRPQGLGATTAVTFDAQTLISQKHVGVVTLAALVNNQHGKVMGRWNSTTNTLEARSILIK